jgi:hypothetical protein
LGDWGTPCNISFGREINTRKRETTNNVTGVEKSLLALADVVRNHGNDDDDQQDEECHHDLSNNDGTVLNIKRVEHMCTAKQ